MCIKWYSLVRSLALAGGGGVDQELPRLRQTDTHTRARARARTHARTPAVQLNDKLGSLNRCQGGLFSSMVDKTPMDMCFRMRPGLTSVRVIDIRSSLCLFI